LKLRTLGAAGPWSWNLAALGWIRAIGTGERSMWPMGAHGGGGLQPGHALPGAGVSSDADPGGCLARWVNRNHWAQCAWTARRCDRGPAIARSKPVPINRWKPTSTLNLQGCRWRRLLPGSARVRWLGRPRRPGRHMATRARPSPDECGGVFKWVATRPGQALAEKLGSPKFGLEAETRFLRCS